MYCFLSILTAIAEAGASVTALAGIGYAAIAMTLLVAFADWLSSR